MLVTNWESLAAEKIHVALSFESFLRSIRLGFGERLGPNFRLYTLPVGFKLVEERKRVDKDNFMELLKVLSDHRATHPLLYVWNNDEESPKKIPLLAPI